MGSYSLASAYACLIWPQFVEVSGMIFHGGVSAQDVEDWLAHTQGNKQSVEATVQLRLLSQTLRASWEAKLANDFPSRQFVVDFIEGSKDEPREYQVLFYERREG